MSSDGRAGDRDARGAPSPDAEGKPGDPNDDARTVEDLRAIMARLYGPGGCPWDGEQTHESLRGSLIEEAYEAVEAIDRGDLAGLREELGDLLMQIVFHTTIAEAAGEFGFDEVVEAICRKMLRRHPHVFAGEEAADSSAVWTRWEEIKAQERAESGAGESPASVLASLPRALPALQRAQALIGRAERSRLAPPGAAADASPLEALEGALEALRARADGSDTDARGEALGALLWAAARYARAHDLAAEDVLRERANAFIAAVTASAAGPAAEPPSGGAREAG